jgi:hypothetical protein
VGGQESELEQEPLIKAASEHFRVRVIVAILWPCKFRMEG